MLADRSDLSRLIATGPDYLDLLHRLSTGDVASLSPGQGRPTVLTTAKGRIVERLFVHHGGERGVLSVAGRGAGSPVVEHLKRFTFAEQTGLEDATRTTFQLALVGPRAVAVLESIDVEPPDRFGSREASIADVPVLVLGEDGHSADGFSVTGKLDAVGRSWTALEAAVRRLGGLAAGDEALEAWRILRGLPASGHELTEEHNPLEAGLWDAVDFDKGCYVGQEVVARLRTYDKVSRSIVGLDLSDGGELPQPGAKLVDAERTVGQLTSVTTVPGRAGAAGLGYVKRRELRDGMTLRCGEADDAPYATVVELPFPRQ